MSPRWIRLDPDRHDDLRAAIVAGALGVGVGLVAFYFARLLSAREPLRLPAPRGEGAESNGDA